jgi:hypothetical protein
MLSQSSCILLVSSGTRGETLYGSFSTPYTNYCTYKWISNETVNTIKIFVYFKPLAGYETKPHHVVHSHFLIRKFNF